MTELEVRAFLAIMNAGSISAAAARLHVTQPALSRRIQALENELGYLLLRRRKGMRMVELTEEGTAFIPLAEKYLSLWQEAKDITRFDRNNLLNISSIGSVSAYILPPVFSRFMAAYPACRLNFHQCHSFEAYACVSTGQFDIALISDEMRAGRTPAPARRR